MIPNAPYRIKLDAFQGPLDLLLMLIKKSEVNIYDIPIAEITEQYVEYLELSEEIDLETAGDYMLMAAELGAIKSKMMLPKPRVDAEDEEQDPRAELVRRLIEYKRYRDAGLKLLGLDILGRDVFANPAAAGEPSAKKEQSLQTADLMSLVDAFYEILRRGRAEAETDFIEFTGEAMTVDEKIADILSRLRADAVLRAEAVFRFESLAEGAASRYETVITFLAVLELVRAGIVGISQKGAYLPIELIYLGRSENWTTMEKSSNAQ
ncbi:MAG: segregation and condensation protein A [Deltaproteobacteria bacterium]